MTIMSIQFIIIFEQFIRKHNTIEEI